jgi:hypothetical protein
MRLNLKTMWYERDDTIDIEEWKERVSGNGSSSKRKKPKTKEDLLELVPKCGDIAKTLLEANASDVGIGEKKFSLFYTQLLNAKDIYEHAVKRSRMRDQKRVSRSAYHASYETTAATV